LKKAIAVFASVSCAILVVGVSSVDAHDLFLRPFPFFVKPHNEVVVRLINGTFDRSEAAVARNRFRDLSVVSPQGRMPVRAADYAAGADFSQFSLTVGAAGTYVLGASTTPRIIRLSGDDFNEYLRTDGLPDVLDERRRSGNLADSASERYSKHVKTIFQVGGKRTSQFNRALGYPAELVPLGNPYDLKGSGRLTVRALVDSRPVARQLVLFGGRTRAGTTIKEDSTRTDSTGTAKIPLSRPAFWYIKFISMKKVRDSVNYESKWATLTFELR
jgi:uncharacterized GH25 family protein